jgi:ribosomal protein S21
MQPLRKDKKSPHFAKELGFDKLISELDKRVKKLLKFQNEKARIEHDLEVEARKVAEKIEDKFSGLRKYRKWETVLNSIKVKDGNPIDYVTKKIKKVCYEEAEKHVRKGHKLYHALGNKRKKCLNILYTGSHIQPTLVELSKEMKTANIELQIPSSLLALPPSK